MPKLFLATPINTDDGGIGLFDHFLDRVDRTEMLQAHLAFLGMTIAEVRTFASDYLVRLESDGIEMIIYNDDVGSEELGTSSEETVFLSISAPTMDAIERFRKVLETHLRIAETV